MLKEGAIEFMALFVIGNLFFFFIEAPLMNTMRMIVLGDLSITKALKLEKDVVDENENKLDVKNLNKEYNDFNGSKIKSN